MSSQPDDSPGVSRVPDSVVDYCARPRCRREFRRSTGRGRPRDYCSDTCRRSAQNELREARLRLARFEALVAQFRTDVAAFTGDTEAETGEVAPRLRALEALAEAKGAHPFLVKSDDAGARAFVALYEGVAPFLRLSTPAT